MAETYNFKLIKSGDHIEAYEYKDKSIKTGFKRKPRSLHFGGKHTKKGTQQIKDMLGDDYEYYKKHEGKFLVNEEEEPNLFNRDILAKQKEDEKKQKAKSSLRRTRNEIRRRINCNPQLTTFLTLTFAESMTNVKQANYIFNKFTKRMITKFGSFEYLQVIEFQKDEDYYGNKKEHGGSVHYHLLCNLEIPEFKDKPERFAYERHFAKTCWKQGFTTIKPIEHVDNMGAYFSKYLGKDMFDERMFNKRKYNCSQSLKKPEIITGDKAKKLLKELTKNIKPNFEKDISTEWTGLIEYKTYITKKPEKDDKKSENSN